MLWSSYTGNLIMLIIEKEGSFDLVFPGVFSLFSLSMLGCLTFPLHRTFVPLRPDHVWLELISPKLPLLSQSGI
jgi:hypothetical protein